MEKPMPRGKKIATILAMAAMAWVFIALVVVLAVTISEIPDV